MAKIDFSEQKAIGEMTQDFLDVDIFKEMDSYPSKQFRREELFSSFYEENGYVEQPFICCRRETTGKRYRGMQNEWGGRSFIKK